MSEVFNYIDYLGTFVFAITAASIAGRAGFDFFGMLFLAFLTAVGGGTVRDVIISQPVFWTVTPLYLYIILAATFSTFFLLKFYERNAKILFFLDTLGLGTFAVIGTHKTLILGYNGETAFIMGTISAVLGGILRSAFSKEFSILVNKELYATVAGIAALIFILLSKQGVNANLSAVIIILVTFAIRYTAVKYKLKVPSLEDE